MEKFIYGRKALVTGATSGIGKAAAEALAERGYEVWGVSRSAGRSEETRGKGKLILRPMNITDEASVKAVLDEMGSFSLLVNAAGFGIGGSAEDSDPALVRALFETNYFGTVNLTRLALPVMRMSPSSLVIVITSVAARVPLPFQCHYSATKYALEAHFEALRMESARFGVRVAVIEPGDLSTGFTAERRCAIDSSSPYWASYRRAIAQIEKDERGGGSPSGIAAAIVKTAGRRNPPVRTVCGFRYRILCFLMRIFPDRLILFILSRMYRV